MLAARLDTPGVPFCLRDDFQALCPCLCWPQDLKTPPASHNLVTLFEPEGKKPNPSVAGQLVRVKNLPRCARIVCCTWEWGIKVWSYPKSEQLPVFDVLLHRRGVQVQRNKSSRFRAGVSDYCPAHGYKEISGTARNQLNSAQFKPRSARAATSLAVSTPWSLAWIDWQEAGSSSWADASKK